LTGTFLFLTAMRALPFGVPKLLISSVIEFISVLKALHTDPIKVGFYLLVQE
jgi:uncharacterized protein (UPF0261 family)